jgi:hypothetical protein
MSGGFMDPINKSFSFEQFKLEKFKPKEKNGASEIMSRVAKEMRRPLGKYIGKELSKVRHITAVQKEANAQIKEDLINAGKGEGLKLEVGKRILDGFKFLNPKEPGKWIVVFNGMGDQYEFHLEALEKLSEDVGANVLAFNYRGFGESSGKPASIDDWVEDGRYMLKYLEQSGVKAENITIYGHSMGGGIASEVYEKQEAKSSLIMESSPSAFVKAIKSRRGTLAGVAAKISRWDFNSYKVIKDAAAQSKANIALVVNRRDPIVRYQDSLYKKLAKNGAGIIQRVKIGDKQEEFGKVSVKAGIKEFGKAKTSKNPLDKKEISEEAKEYRNAYGELRKEGSLKNLPHPHHRVMDRRAAKPVVGEDAEKFRLFEEKFQKEDEKAYEEIVKVFKGFLNIP